jgi:hypothetical protein
MGRKRDGEYNVGYRNTQRAGGEGIYHSPMGEGRDDVAPLGVTLHDLDLVHVLPRKRGGDDGCREGKDDEFHDDNVLLRNGCKNDGIECVCVG